MTPHPPPTDTASSAPIHSSASPPTASAPSAAPPSSSLREPTLANADPAYLLTLRSGLSFVLNGILLLIVTTITFTVLALALTSTGNAVTLVLEGALIIVSGIILFGYWKFTTPDPSQVALETTRSARATIRLVVAAQAVIAVAGFILELIGTSLSTPPAPGAPGPTLNLAEILSNVLMVIGVVFWVIQFFAVMRYTRWLATRVPDFLIVKRAKGYMWFLPLIYVLGAACVGLGPLFALILYWNLLDRLRKHVKSIIKDGVHAPLKNMPLADV
ncbi:MAG: hypothetical protein KIT19_13215 [Phycisphaeraceae bacterium]|nr:hypothetical protein [Phycisphaeraceae bacterium]